jgi:hypothetical protein
MGGHQFGRHHKIENKSMVTKCHNQKNGLMPFGELCYGNILLMGTINHVFSSKGFKEFF